MIDQKTTGGRKGYDADDYREAAEKTGSIRGIARELGVSRTTARAHCSRHDIYLESIGGVPNS
jgi:ribosomal protein S14